MKNGLVAVDATSIAGALEADGVFQTMKYARLPVGGFVWVPYGYAVILTTAASPRSVAVSMPMFSKALSNNLSPGVLTLIKDNMNAFDKLEKPWSSISLAVKDWVAAL